jgi:hypothetical protein
MLISGRWCSFKRQIGAEAMSLYVLDAVFWTFGIRGHVPQNGDFPSGPKKSPLAANAKRLLRVLAASVVAMAFLSLILWATVWLSLKLL